MPRSSLVVLLAATAAAAYVQPPPVRSRHAASAVRASTPRMDFMEDLQKIVKYNIEFAGKAVKAMFSSQTASASHVLVKSATEAATIKEQIAAGELSFEEAAKQFSTCPSSAKGGALGEFKPGQMVPEFDSVVFDPNTAIGGVYTATTQFGTHLIKVTARTEPE